MAELEVDNKICEYRKALGLSQHKLARAVGLKRRSIMALGRDFKEVFLFKEEK